VPMALLLILASRLRGRVLALLALGRREPRVAATSGFVAWHFRYLAGHRNCPPLSGPLRCASVGAGLLDLLRAACVFVRHYFYGKPRAEVNWRMGVYAPPHREIYPRSPALLFRCHRAPLYHTKIVNREPKAKSDRVLWRCFWDRGNRVKNTSGTTKSRFVCGGAACSRFFDPQLLAKEDIARSPGPSRKKSTIAYRGNPRNQICIFPRARYTWRRSLVVEDSRRISHKCRPQRIQKENHNPIRSASA
jgi:hypothetical protein